MGRTLAFLALAWCLAAADGAPLRLAACCRLDGPGVAWAPAGATLPGDMGTPGDVVCMAPGSADGVIVATGPERATIWRGTPNGVTDPLQVPGALGPARGVAEREDGSLWVGCEKGLGFRSAGGAWFSLQHCAYQWVDAFGPHDKRTSEGDLRNVTAVAPTDAGEAVIIGTVAKGPTILRVALSPTAPPVVHDVAHSAEQMQGIDPSLVPVAAARLGSTVWCAWRGLVLLPVKPTTTIVMHDPRSGVPTVGRFWPLPRAWLGADAEGQKVTVSLQPPPPGHGGTQLADTRAVTGRCMAVSPRQVLWAAASTFDGPSLYSFQPEGWIEHLGARQALGQGDPTSMAFSPTGTLYVATDAGRVVEFDGTEWRVSPVTEALRTWFLGPKPADDAELPPCLLTCDAGGRLWVAAGRCLFVFEEGK
jgi:hypothetical protein